MQSRQQSRVGSNKDNNKNNQDVIVHTIEFLGTSENTKTNRSLLTEIHDILGPENSTIIQGIGTGNTIPTENKKFYHDIRDKIGQLTGHGLEQSILDAMAKIEKLVENNPDKKIILNLVGFSRGAVATLRLAMRLKYTHPNIELNIFGIEPVAGTGNTDDWDAGIIPSNVKNIDIIYHTDEKRPGFEPQGLSDLFVEDVQKTKVSSYLYPGIHETSVTAVTPRHEKLSSGQSTEDAMYHLAGPAKIVAYQLVKFLKNSGVTIPKDKLKKFFIYQEENSLNKSKIFDINLFGNSKEMLKEFHEIIEISNKGDFKPHKLRRIEKGPQFGGDRKDLEIERFCHTQDYDIFINELHRNAFKAEAIKSHPQLFNLYFRENSLPGKNDEKLIKEIQKSIEKLPPNDPCYLTLQSLNKQIKAYLKNFDYTKLKTISQEELAGQFKDPKTSTAKAIAIAIIYDLYYAGSDCNLTSSNVTPNPKAFKNTVLRYVGQESIIIPPKIYLERHCSNTPHATLYIQQRGEIINLDKTIEELILGLRTYERKYPFLTNTIAELKTLRSLTMNEEYFFINDTKETRQQLQFIIDDTMKCAIEVPSQRGKRPVENLIHNILKNNSTSDKNIQKILENIGIDFLGIKYRAHAEEADGFSKEEIDTAKCKLALIRLPQFQRFVLEELNKAENHSVIEGHIRQILIDAQPVNEINAAINNLAYITLSNLSPFNKNQIKNQFFLTSVDELLINNGLIPTTTNDKITVIQDEKADRIQQEIMENYQGHIASVIVHGKPNHKTTKQNQYTIDSIDLNNYSKEVITIKGPIKIYFDEKGKIITTTNDYRLQYLLKGSYLPPIKGKEIIKIPTDIDHNEPTKDDSITNIQFHEKKAAYNSGISQCNKYRTIRTQKFLKDLALAPYQGSTKIQATDSEDNLDDLNQLLGIIQTINSYFKDRAKETKKKLLGARTSSEGYYLRRNSWIKILAKLVDTINLTSEVKNTTQANQYIKQLEKFILVEANKFKDSCSEPGHYFELLSKLHDHIHDTCRDNIPTNLDFNQRIFSYQQMYTNMNICTEHAQKNRGIFHGHSLFNNKSNQTIELIINYDKKAYKQCYEHLKINDQDFFLTPEEEFQTEWDNTQYYSSPKNS